MKKRAGCPYCYISFFVLLLLGLILIGKKWVLEKITIGCYFILDFVHHNLAQVFTSFLSLNLHPTFAPFDHRQSVVKRLFFYRNDFDQSSLHESFLSSAPSGSTIGNFQYRRVSVCIWAM